MIYYLCERCGSYLTGYDLMPITNYGSRDFRNGETPAGQCICGGICYEATEGERLADILEEFGGHAA